VPDGATWALGTCRPSKRLSAAPLKIAQISRVILPIYGRLSTTCDPERRLLKEVMVPNKTIYTREADIYTVPNYTTRDTIVLNIDIILVLLYPEEVEVDVAKLKRLREDRVLSQRELARLAGLTHVTVWRLENGFTEAHAQTIRKIAEVLGVKPRELVKREE
jgi:DNA-binding XRE family transcriptional regulator